MRYIATFLTILLFILAGPVFCAKVGSKHKPIAKQITVYAQSSSSSAEVAKKPLLHIWNRLVPFHRKGDWVKVGIKHSGKVGWINIKEYHKLLRAQYRPYVKSVYLKVIEKPNQKGEVTVVGYTNGKKLSHQQAKRLFNKMQKRQRMQWRKLMRLQRQMHRTFNSMLREFDSFGATTAFPMPVGWPTTPLMQPVIVVEDKSS